MPIAFDQFWFLSREDSSLPQLKSYHYSISGLSFASYDKRVFVYYKRQWKRIQLKNLGDGMQLAYQVSTRPNLTYEWQEDFLTNALSLFKGFNEETGQVYHFLPFFKKDSALLFSLLEKTQLWARFAITPGTTKILGLEHSFQWPKEIAEKVWFLFALVLLYGKFDLKNDFITSIKIHLPLLWASAQIEEQFISLVQELQESGIFFTLNLHQQGTKKTLELSSSDFELIAIFSQRYEALRLGKLSEGISPLESKHLEIKNQLLDFLEEEEEAYCTPELIAEIKSSTLKFLK